MSEHPKAVFLSYASQDVEAAKRIADTLRGAGVEVWFDADGGLEHGDEWDAKIRRQIKECVLFIPIISANTQAREEGYFRLEWDLAAERARTIASGVAFILPVVVDETREPEALVPDRFRTVQWTKLAGGSVSADVLQRFLKLWSHRAGALKQVSGEPGARSREPERAADQVRKPVLGKGGGLWLIGAGVVAGIVAVAWFVFRPASTVPGANVPPKVSSALPSAGPSEGLTMAAKAYALTQRVGFTREDLALAEGLTQKAVELEPESARVRSIYAWVRACYLMRNWDLSPKRLQEVQTAANRALGLDPNDPDALNALAHIFEKQRVPAEAEKLARRAVGASADNYRGWLLLGRAQELQGRSEEARATLEQAVAKYPDNPLCRYELANNFAGLGSSTRLLNVANMTAALEQLEAAIAIRPFASAILLKAVWEAACKGDLVRMRAELDRLDAAPVTDRTEDRAVHIQIWAGLLERRPDRALAAAKLTARVYFEDLIIAGPKAWGTAHAYRIAGKEALARQEWENAEAVLRQRLRDQPSAVETVRLATTLAWKGEADEAARLVAPIEPAWREDLTKPNARDLARYYAAQGNAAKAVPLIREVLNYNSFITDALLPLDPWWDKLRGQPEFEALLAECRARLEAQIHPRNTVTTGAKGDASVAVLAFADLSEKHDSEYFSDGISEELLNVLAKVPGLKVSARTSAFFFKGKEVPIPEIARQLGVAYVVEGSVRKAGDKVRITAQLIKAADGFHVWSESFTRDLKDIFAVQDEIAGLVANQLSLKLGASSAASSVAVDPRAFELYVQARQAWNLRNEEGFARAERLLQQALELAPGFARAHAALADVWYFQTVLKGVTGTFARPDPPEFVRVLAKIREALALDPGSAEARAALGNVLFSSWKRAEAEQEYRRAIGLNPNYASAHQWLAALLTTEGRIDEALAECRLARELDPLSSRIADNYGNLLLLAGRYSESLAQYERAIELQPSNYQAVSFKPLLMASLGRMDEAVALARALPASLPVKPSTELSVYAAAGRRHEAEAILPAARAGGVVPACFLFLLLDRKEEAIAALNANDVDAPGDYLLPQYDLLDDDPRFRKFIATIGMTEARARIRTWRAAHPPEKLAVTK